MITKTAHMYIAKSIRNASMSNSSRVKLVADLSEYFERDNPATFNPKLFAAVARGSKKDIDNVEI